jgi:hypothetical protein
MKRHAWNGKAFRQNKRRLQRGTSTGDRAVALAPPACGIEFVDQGLAIEIASGSIASTAGPAQRQSTPEDREVFQGKNNAVATEPLKHAPTPNRTGMPDQLKSGIESLSGLDVSGVRVHSNSDKPAQFNALAYAQGTDIHIAPGQDRHLPHEAWHVIQQAQGRVAPKWQAKGVAMNNDKGLEQEADVMAHKALQSRRSAGSDPSARRGDDAGTLDRHTEETEDKSSVEGSGQHAGRTRALGLLTAITPTVQCRLSVNATIDPRAIANVKKLAKEKLVFRLTDKDGSELVVKAEGKVKAEETVEEMGTRFSLGQYAAKHALQIKGTPDMELLGVDERDNLATNLPDVGDAAELKGVLTAEDHIFYKAGMVQVGESLFERGAFKRVAAYTRKEKIKGKQETRTVEAEKTTKSYAFLLTEDVWEQWGKTALLDLLTDNKDRFPFSEPIEQAAPNFENLDLSPSGEVLAFDNLDKAALMRKGDWRCEDNVKDAKKYCSFFVSNICQRWTVNEMAVPQAQAAFWRGFSEGSVAMQSKKTKDYLKGLKSKDQKKVVTEFLRRIKTLKTVES